MKTVYFVRHGQSEGNVGNFAQKADTPLTDLGHQQARIVADRCAKLDADHLISSTMRRAQETAAAISQQTGLEVELSDLFCERHNPPHIHNVSRSDPVALNWNEKWWHNFGNSEFNGEGGDTYFTLRDRAQAALDFLLTHSGESLIVVSHGLFMRALLACVVHGDDLTPLECRRFIRTFQMENTGLSALRFSDDLDPPHWWVWIWNDHAHLG